MGHINKILKERKIGKGFYDDSIRIELQEAFHIHYKDLRLLFRNPETFEALNKAVTQAYRKWTEMGKPFELKDMALLSDVVLPDSGVGNRLAVELQKDGRVHIHYNDLRVHITTGDLLNWMEVFEQSQWNLINSGISIDIDLNDCDYHDIVDVHLETLNKYNSNEGLNINDVTYKKENIGLNFKTIKNVINNYMSSFGSYITRNFGLPKDFDAHNNEKADKLYLCSLYEVIKEYGYGNENPLTFGKLISAYKKDDGKLYVMNSHRLAVLKYLGYEKVKGYLVEKES